MPRFSDIKVNEDGGFDGVYYKGEESAIQFSASFDLFLIKEARHQGVDFEDLADGFGLGKGTMGGDWSGIRDSSPEAINRMLERALNTLFPRE